MQTVKSFIGYAWGACAILFVLACFIGSDYFSHRLAAATGVKISPWFSGGEVVATIEHGTYRALVHRPVFDGLFSERRDGFIQVRWEARQTLPATVKEAVDYDGDGRTDFSITLDTTNGAASLADRSPSVVGIKGTYKLKTGWAARILLRKQA
jgi:hypothetical protein